MAQQYEVETERDGAAGRYVIRLAPGFEAEMTFRQVGPDTIAIDHTGTPPEYRGQGIADQLMRHAIAEAERTGTKIVPLCSYVAAQFRRHPAWSGLLAD
jgi:uncharacterized protein